MPYESFIPGIDSGLQAWLRMREVAREARLKGGDSTCVIKDVPYKYYHNWVESLYRLKPDEIDLFINGEEHILFNYHVPILPPIGILDSSKTPLNISDFASLDGASLEEFYIRILRERASVYLSQLLQEPGFLINRKVGARKRTLLHLACDFGDLDKARLIITAGANVQIRDGRGQTALHLSLHLAEEVQQSAELLRLLLQRRAVINAQDHQGRTALHYTCMLQSLYLTDLLLGEGADLSISDAHNHMPGHYARQGDMTDLITRYISKPHRRSQLVKIQARRVAQSFVRDIFYVVQPKCVTCRQTTGQCLLSKQANFRCWLFTHGQLRREFAGSALTQLRQQKVAEIVRDHS